MNSSSHTGFDPCKKQFIHTVKNGSHVITEWNAILFYSKFSRQHECKQDDLTVYLKFYLQVFVIKLQKLSLVK